MYSFDSKTVVYADHWSEKFWLITTEYNVYLVGGKHANNALDNLVDHLLENDLFDNSFMLDEIAEKEYEENNWSIQYVGNYGDPVCLNNVSISEVTPTITYTIKG